jgi:hypothetical protein
MSSIPASDVLTLRQLTFIAERLPEPPSALRGRRPYTNQELLQASCGYSVPAAAGGTSTGQDTHQASRTGAGCVTGIGGPGIAGSGAHS